MAHVAPRPLTAVLLCGYRYSCYSPWSNGKPLSILAGYRWVGLIPYARQFTKHQLAILWHEDVPWPPFTLYLRISTSNDTEGQYWPGLRQLLPSEGGSSEVLPLAPSLFAVRTRFKRELMTCF